MVVSDDVSGMRNEMMLLFGVTLFQVVFCV